MWDNVDLGASPGDDECAMVGTPDYEQRGLLEMREFKRMMTEIWPPPPMGRYQIKSNPHDFGYYYSLQAAFWDGDETAANWAYEAEDKVPEHWDAEAQAVILGYLHPWLERKAK